MPSIDEKRVFGRPNGSVEAYVASSAGLLRVRVSNGSVGEFGMLEPRRARDVAADGRAVAVATDEDVLLVDVGSTEEPDGPSILETGFGPATVVGFHDGSVIAIDPDGRIGRLSPLSSDESNGRPSNESDDRFAGEFVNSPWVPLEPELEGVRAIDGNLVGAETGVYRIRRDRLDHAGLSGVTDVAASGVPLAATDGGLYKLGNGWMAVLEGSFETVAVGPRSDRASLVCAHAVSGERLFEYDDGEWDPVGRSSDRIVDIAYGATPCGVTAAGRFLTITGDEWRSRNLGVEGIESVAIPASDGGLTKA